MFADESPDWNLDLDGSVTCELCGEEPAALHLLRVVDGVINHTHLCPSCAETVTDQTEGLALVLAVPSVLRRLGRGAPEAEDIQASDADQDVRFCAVCGTTLSDLKESGVVGCTKCYQVFSEYLATSVSGAAEPVEHLGKIPHCGPEDDTLRHEMMRLERMLRELVACERFEEAAGVRDRLTELGERLEGGAA